MMDVLARANCVNRWSRINTVLDRAFVMILRLWLGRQAYRPGIFYSRRSCYAQLVSMGS